jgi:hypothetical protein
MAPLSKWDLKWLLLLLLLLLEADCGVWHGHRIKDLY